MGGSLAAAVYTAAIEYNKQQHLQTFANQSFSLGSGDWLLQESLSTGDVILFSRRWYRYHIPAALAIVSYQLLFGTEFDHLGVILCDEHGDPHLVEETFFGGYKSRRFEQRILCSQAQQIVAVPLVPRGDVSEEQKSRLKAFVSRARGGGECLRDHGVVDDLAVGVRARGEPLVSIASEHEPVRPLH